MRCIGWNTTPLRASGLSTATDTRFQLPGSEQHNRQSRAESTPQESPPRKFPPALSSVDVAKRRQMMQSTVPNLTIEQP
jgi:hypothetical protein